MFSSINLPIVALVSSKFHYYLLLGRIVVETSADLTSTGKKMN